MAHAQIDRLVVAIREDAALQRQFSGVPAEPEAFIGKLLEVGQAQGYSFTADEARAWYVDQVQARADGELSEVALDAVAGGAMFPSPYILPGGIPTPFPNGRR